MSDYNDTYEVIDGEYYIDETGDAQPDRRKEESKFAQTSPSEDKEDGQFFVDSNGNISRDRREPSRTKSGAIIMEASTSDSFVEFR